MSFMNDLFDNDDNDHCFVLYYTFIITTNCSN